MRMERGDIAFITLDPTLGTEQRGRRPVLCLTPAKFTDATGLAVVLAITTKGSNKRLQPFMIDLPDGLPVTGRIMCHQMRSIDPSKRDPDVKCRLPDDDMARIECILTAIIKG